MLLAVIQFLFCRSFLLICTIYAAQLKVRWQVEHTTITHQQIQNKSCQLVHHSWHQAAAGLRAC